MQDYPEPELKVKNWEDREFLWKLKVKFVNSDQRARGIRKIAGQLRVGVSTVKRVVDEQKAVWSFYE